MQTLLTTKQVAEMLNVKPKTVNNWRCSGRGPGYVKLGGSVRYCQKTVAEWIESSTVM